MQQLQVGAVLAGPVGNPVVGQAGSVQESIPRTDDAPQSNRSVA